MAIYKGYSYSTRKQKRQKITLIIFLILFAFFSYTLIHQKLIASYKVKDHSMQPLFVPGSRIALSLLDMHKTHINRGDIVLVSDQAEIEKKKSIVLFDSFTRFFSLQFLSLKDSAKHCINTDLRRIVGMPGDTIYMKDFVLYVKPQGESYFLTEFEVSTIDYDIKKTALPKNWTTELPFAGAYPQTVLKENEYFVLCDNRMINSDSRLWGTISTKKNIVQKSARAHYKAFITGKIIFPYWKKQAKTAL